MFLVIIFSYLAFFLIFLTDIILIPLIKIKGEINMNNSAIVPISLMVGGL